MKDCIKAFLLIFLFSLLLLGRIYWQGFPFGHSTDYNLFWQQAFTAQILQGEWYPRWLDSAMMGLGAPIFFFYAPLPFYFYTLISLLGFSDPYYLHSIVYVLITALSGFSLYSLALRLCQPIAALLFAFLYMALPYHMGDLTIRAAIGEVFAYLFVPLLLLSLLHYRRSRLQKIAVAGLLYGLLVLSHLPSALLVSIAIVIYCVFLEKEHWLKGLLDAAAIGFGGVLFAAAYILPALMLKAETLPFDAWITASGSHFKAVNWLIGMENRLGFGVYIVLAFVTFMAFLFLLLARINPLRSDKPVLKASLVILFICWLMMTKLTYGLWDNIDMLAQVQFPWRLGFLVDFTAIVIMIFAYSALHGNQPKKANLILLASLAVVTVFSIVFVFPKSVVVKQEVINIPERQAIEYRPKWLVESEVYLHGNNAEDLLVIEKARAIHDEGFINWKQHLAGKALLSEKTARAVFDSNQDDLQLMLNIKVQQPGTFVLKKIFYPHWMLAHASTGKPIALEADPMTGLIQFSLAQGEYSLVLKKQILPVEKTGYLLSFLGMLFLGILFILGRKNH